MESYQTRFSGLMQKMSQTVNLVVAEVKLVNVLSNLASSFEVDTIDTEGFNAADSYDRRSICFAVPSRIIGVRI